MPHEFIREIASEAEMDRFGRLLSEALTPGCVVALVGDLGAGKTRLVQSIAVGMGVAQEDVTSPTFMLIQEYPGRIPLYHFDTYRLKDSDEFLELGADELMDGEGVCLIEWANRVDDVLPRDHLSITIDITGAETRTLTIRSTGAKADTIVEQLQKM